MVHVKRTCLAVLLLTAPGALRAQEDGQVPVAVVDSRGEPIPFAVVSIRSGKVHVADAQGTVRMPAANADSLELHVRRIGYKESYGWAKPAADGRFVVELTQLAASLSAVTVTERANIPLAQRGFYDRLERAKRGAVVGLFVTPEELEARPRAKLTDVMQGLKYVRVWQTRPTGGPIHKLLLGRGGCPMNIVLDGQLVTGTVQEDVPSEAPTSIDFNGTRRSAAFSGQQLKPDIDAIITGGSVMAIEIYPSSANAPPEIIPFNGNGSCGIVAIWTGSRR